MKKEEWKYIDGTNNKYMVSDIGRVKSLKFNKERILSQFNLGDYKGVCLNIFSKRKNLYVHILVAKSFIEERNEKNIVVDHIDNDPFNNNLDNLQYITQRENVSKDKKCSKKYTSKHTGVSLKNGKWGAYIKTNEKFIYLGTFICELEASEAYQLALQNIDAYDGDNKKFRELLKLF